MKKCGCYDPGYILGQLTGIQNGRAVNNWLQEEMKKVPSLAEHAPLDEKSAAWMGSAAGGEGIQDLFSMSRAEIPGLERGADLALEIKGAQGLKTMLETFLSLLSANVRLINLIVPSLEAEVFEAKAHLSMRLLRAILISLGSDALLAADSTDGRVDKTSWWGNTQNEAQLVYNDDLPRVLVQCLNDGDASILSDWAGMLRLPATNVAYFNYLSGDVFQEEAHYYPALAVSLALSGLPGLNGLAVNGNLAQVRRLMEARQKSSVFHPASAQMVVQVDRRVFALMKISPDALETALCLVNLSAERVHLTPDAAELGLPKSGWQDLVSGEPARLDESGITLEGYGAAWLSHAI